MNKGVNVTGVRLFDKGSQKYHVAHHGSRHYLCGCCPSIKIDGVYKHCLGKRRQYTRIKNYTGGMMNLWSFLQEHKESLKNK